MARWQPDARGRLGQAAMELYDERGYEQTTVAEIADRAGLTARTFFRYFADKREVLFSGSELLGDALARSVAEAPESLAPLEIVAAALHEAALFVGSDRSHSLRRQAIIAAHADLQERELIKLASWSRILARELRVSGVDDRVAGLAAEAGVAVFRAAFERWLTGPAGPTLPAVLHDSFEDLRTLATPR